MKHGTHHPDAKIRETLLLAGTQELINLQKNRVTAATTIALLMQRAIIFIKLNGVQHTVHLNNNSGSSYNTKH
jgi:hypothetical protein